MKEGFRPKPQREEDGLTRRAVINGLGMAGAAVGGYLAYKEHRRQTGEQRESSEEQLEFFGERFSAEISGYAAQVGLRHNEIIFVDEHNIPIGEPIDFSDAIGDEYKEGGICISPPPKYWRDEQVAALEAAHSGRKVARSYNVALVFKAACSYDDEPALQTGLHDGSITTFSDIIDYFASKPVLERDGTLSDEENLVSRLDYVKDHIVFDDVLPDVLQAELRVLTPGICAQESKFNNGLKSPDGALGIFQFMPWVFEHYGYSTDEILSLRIQTEVAGKLFSDIYREVLHHCGDEALARARQSFATTDEFLTQFVLPLMVNSYNAGSSRVGEAVNSFFTPNYRPEQFEGLDVFLAMADAALQSTDEKLNRYGEHAREYVPRVYAHASILGNRK